MRLSDDRVVAHWQENDLLNIPSSETDYYEYKSSKILMNPKWNVELAQKICCAASAFWNIGGGVFVVGVDDTGQIDGGIPATVGKQPIRAWVDQVIRDVQPVGPYEVGVIQSSGTGSLIEPDKMDKIVLITAFGESFNVPHMSSDKKHYARLGVHTEPASYYLLEAMRARRGLHQPMLRGLLRGSEQKRSVLELAILAVNDVPAVNLSVTFDPLPNIFSELSGEREILPLQVPIVDRLNPFSMEIAFNFNPADTLGSAPFFLLLEYEDIAGRKFQESQQIDFLRSLGPFRFGDDPLHKIEKALEKISDRVQRLTQVWEWYLKNLQKTDDRRGETGEARE
jgi:hypothetical protein